MDILIAPSIVGIVIQVIGSIVVALIYVRGKKQGEKEKPSQLVGFKNAIIGGIAAAITFALIGLILNVFVPKPSVAITIPSTSQQIEVRLVDTGSGSFTVSGISSEVFSDPNLRIYVLVHPADPPAAGWWIQQPSTVEQNGQWSTLAWIGSNEFPPHVGDKIEILVVATNPEHVTGLVKISDPKDIKPVAQSSIIRVSIGVTK